MRGHTAPRVAVFIHSNESSVGQMYFVTLSDDGIEERVEFIFDDEKHIVKETHVNQTCPALQPLAVGLVARLAVGWCG